MGKDQSYWVAFSLAWDEQRFIAFLTKWLSEPERSLSEVQALCDLLKYDPIAEYATIEALSRLERDTDPSETPLTA